MSLKTRWNRACAETIGTDMFWHIAVDHLSIAREMAPLIDRYANGVILDAGAGRLAWRNQLAAQSTHYVAIDYEPSHSQLGFVADIQGGIPLKDASIDTIFCCSVFEHTPEPWRILPEFRRILKYDGKIILSVPFLYYLHGAPHDYFRFTKHGITRLADVAGLKVVELRPAGGTAHAMGQAFSVIWAALTWTRRAPWLVTWPVKAIFMLARTLDRLDRQGLFAQTINVVLTTQVSQPPSKP